MLRLEYKYNYLVLFGFFGNTEKKTEQNSYIIEWVLTFRDIKQFYMKGPKACIACYSVIIASRV